MTRNCYQLNKTSSWDWKGGMHKGITACPKTQGTVEGSEGNPNLLGNTSIVRARTGAGWGGYNLI